MKYIFICVALVFIGCKTTTTPMTEAQLTEKSNWIAKDSFKIEAKSANPLSANSLNQLASVNLLPPGDSPNRINLIGRGDFIQINEGIVTASLSYYGTRRFPAANIGDNGGITIKNAYTDFTKEINERKNRTDISFDVRNEYGEQFSISLQIYAKGRADIYVSSNKRDPINYLGNMKGIATE